MQKNWLVFLLLLCGWLVNYGPLPIVAVVLEMTD